MEVLDFKNAKENSIYNNWQLLEQGSSYQKVLCKCLLCNVGHRRWLRYILSGQSTSCGCNKNKRANLKADTIFGHWKIIEIPKTGSHVVVLCLGCKKTTKEIDVHFLFKQRSKSCGCMAQEEYKKTCLELVGVEAYAQCESHKQQKKKSMLDRYGVEHALQFKEFQDKAKQTNFEKYGNSYYSKTSECVNKIQKTMIQKYGVINLTQLPENRNKLRQWCVENPHKLFTSKSELEILSWTQQYYLNTKKYKTQGNELDIFIPDLNLGIELNGLYWHNETHKEKNYHLNKTKYFKQQGIRTIHIWEHEWKFKQEQVKSFLLSALGKNQHKIGARKCNIVWSNSKEEIIKAHQLLDSTHIQGHTNSTKYVANTYHNNTLIATATFGKHHRDSKTWVLSRFTTKTNYTIQGILSKISKLASRELQSDIISWADHRLSDGNGYEKAGWKFEELMRPDYLYWKSGLKIISKQSRQKKLVNTPEGMTEHEHAKLDGLLRIYDCGKIRYRWKL